MTPVVIIGGGLAGTTLAWQLFERGVPFTLIDDGKPTSSSRTAAGLITPITGQHPTVTWRWQELSDVAFPFYTALEHTLGTRFFHEPPTVRLFVSDKERTQFFRCADRVILHETELDSSFKTPFGAATMQPAARLDVPAYLTASHQYFASLGCLTTTLPSRSARTVYATGYAPCLPFAEVPFAASKGEILTLHLPGLRETRTVNRQGTWLTPLGNSHYLAGSTYDKANLDDVPTAEGRETLLVKLRQFLNVPLTVVAQRAAVRPIIRTSKPLVGRRTENDELFYFNGLGSKGSLTAPWAAAQLAALLADGTHVDAEIDVAVYLAGMSHESDRTSP